VESRDRERGTEGNDKRGEQENEAPKVTSVKRVVWGREKGVTGVTFDTLEKNVCHLDP